MATLTGAVSRRHSACVSMAWAALVVATFLLAGHRAAAQDQTPAIVNPGSAVVTGFSGPVPGQAPQGADPTDYIAIDLNGPSARVIDLSTLGPQGQLSQAVKTFTVNAGQVGQVLGVALDSAPQPNFYLAATAAYGLSIYVPDSSGAIKRIRNGAAGAQFLPGQFGPPDQGGGPGSIWRVNGVTGEVTLFSTIDSAAHGVAALGALAFDPRTQQLFVADRSTGLIHRLSLDGADRGTYDHGADGRAAAGLAPVPQGQAAPVDITNPAFDAANPATWGLAAPARRIFGLAVWKDRLYYAVAEGPQVWSLAIGQDGSFAGDVRLEADVPALQDGVEIASITFDDLGRMYLAERGAVTGDYQLTNLASEGVSRVLRLVPKQPGDNSPGQWRPQPDQYAIGLPPGYNNGNGGVALGYGYQPNGAVNIGACRATVWSTGERLLDPGDPNAQPGSYPAVDGLQGNSIDLIEPQNQPPTAAWFIDYNDRPGSPADRGFMGAIQILSPCSAEGAYVPPPPPPPPPLRCPPGSVFDGKQCVVTVSCPPGTVYRNGYCVYESCPPGLVRYRNRCVPPPLVCPNGTAFYNGQCVPVGCPPGMVQLQSGFCACPPGIYFLNGRCVPPNLCPPGMLPSPNGLCWCPPNSYFIGGQCIPNYCPPNYVRVGGECVPSFCQPGYRIGPDGFCRPIFNRCPPDQMPYFNYCVPRFCQPGFYRGNDGYCYPYGNNCGQGQEYYGGRCVTACLPLFKRDLTGICISITEFDRKVTVCEGGKIKIGNACACPPDKRDGPNGTCVPKAPHEGPIKINCVGGHVPQGNQCVCPPGTRENANHICERPGGLPPCADGQVRPGGTGACVCPPDRPDFVNNVCVPHRRAELPPCPDGQVRPGGTGACVCPPDRPDFVNNVCVPHRKPAELPPCADGQVRPGGTGACVCPPDKPDFVNNVCVPHRRAELPPCPDGQVRPGGTGACVCPPDRPDFVNTDCVPHRKPAELPPCADGQVRPGGTGACVCPPDKPDFVNNVCVPHRRAELPPCPDGQVRPGGTGACVCPPDRPDFVNNVCVPHRKAELPPCPDGQVRPGGTGACVCPPDRPQFVNGACIAKAKPAELVICTGGKVREGNACVCPAGTRENAAHVCEKPETKAVQCPPGEEPRGNGCVAKPGQGGNAGAGGGAKPPACVGGHVVNGQCACPPGEHPAGGRCVK